MEPICHIFFQHQAVVYQHFVRLWKVFEGALNTYNEITNAVARETLAGNSAAKSNSFSSQVGSSSGEAGFRNPLDDLSLESIFNPQPPGVSTSGSSFGTSTGISSAESWSSSSGQRDIAAALIQNIVDRTQQASHTARNRRASIVREVSQHEKETITSRTLTNYNHMHSLTVEYYEVVQLYRTVVELSEASRCLFVPMRLIDFSKDPGTIMRFRGVIAANGLHDGIRALSIIDPDYVAFFSPYGIGKWQCTFMDAPGPNLNSIAKTPLSKYAFLPKMATDNYEYADFRIGYWIESIMNDKADEAPIAKAIFQFRSGSTTTLEFEDLEDSRNAFIGRFGVKGGLFSKNKGGHNFTELVRIGLIKKAGKDHFGGKLTFVLSIQTREGGVSLQTTIEVPKNAAQFTVIELTESFSSPDIIQHLNNNTLHYSREIWRSLSPVDLGMLISRYTWPIDGQQRPLLEVLNPNPIAIIANFLVFKISDNTSKDYSSWLDKKKIKLGYQKEDLVPVPSGGVFGEAVLGRFNSAEKLDITRFWNWQDSPIPFQAPDIAAIQAGSRRDLDNTTPGQLGAPVLNIVNPPSVPDPQGMGAILSAIQNGNMFRDMSGLAATIGLAQTGLESTQEGATSAATQAGKNAEIAAQLGAKVADIVGKLVAAYLTKGTSLLSGGGGGDSLAGLQGGISGQGAKINHGQNMDKRGIPTSDGTTGSMPLTTSSTGDDGNVLLTNPDSTSATPIVGNENAAFDTSLGNGSSGGGGIADQIFKMLLGQGPDVQTSNLNATKAQLAIAENIIKADYSKMGSCSKKFLDDMRSNIEASNMLGNAVVAGSIIVWIPKSKEDVIIEFPDALEGLEVVVNGVASIPPILKGTLKKQAQLAYLTCKSLTLAEKNFWLNLDKLLI